MDKIAVEVVMISAQDLKGVANLGRAMRTYAIVWSDSTTKNCTRVDRDGGSYPTWNEKLQMSVSKRFLKQKGSNLMIEIFCKSMFGKKRVGSAGMPYSDVLEGYASPDSLHFLSYRIRMPNGRPRGTVDFSVKFLDKNEPCLWISRPQLEMKNVGFPSKSSRMHARSSRDGNNNNTNNSYAIGIPFSQFAYPQQLHPRGTAYSYSSMMPPLQIDTQNAINLKATNTSDNL